MPTRGSRRMSLAFQVLSPVHTSRQSSSTPIGLIAAPGELVTALSGLGRTLGGRRMLTGEGAHRVPGRQHDRLGAECLLQFCG